MNKEPMPAQGPVDVIVGPCAWAVRRRNPDESTDPWSDIFCNPDTAREEAAALEATSTERFDVVPMYTSVPPVITGTTEEILRDEASGYDPKGLCYVRAGLLLEAADLIAALATERDRFFDELSKVGAGRTATVTKDMIGAAHDVMLAKGDFVLSANLLERIYLAMEQAAPPPQTPFDTCPTCEALARTVMMDQTGAA